MSMVYFIAEVKNTVLIDLKYDLNGFVNFFL